MSALSVLLGFIAGCIGLFAGIILAMASVVQGMLKRLSAQEYAKVMQGIIIEGRKSTVILFLLLVPMLASAIALIVMRENVSEPSFLLTFVGALVYFSGPFMISRRMAEPLYDQIMGWDVQAPPSDWAEYRVRWYRINLLRASSSLAAFILLGMGALLSQGVSL